MTTITVTIPDELAHQASALGVYNEAFIVTAFKKFIEERKNKALPERTLGGAEGVVTYMASDFNDTVDFDEHL